MKQRAKVFTVIVGDLVRSRSSSHRQQLSRLIPLAIKRLPPKYRNEFHAPLVPTRGIDEISGVLKRPYASYWVCRFLNEQIYPEAFRFAIVKGTLDVGLRTNDARRMDGPAFHLAAEIIKLAKKDNMYYCFSLNSSFPEIDLLINKLASMAYILRSDWSNNRWQTVQFYKKFGSQKKAAKELGITQQAVSDALRQAHWREIEDADILIDRVLAQLGKDK